MYKKFDDYLFARKQRNRTKTSSYSLQFDIIAVVIKRIVLFVGIKDQRYILARNFYHSRIISFLKLF